jgi:hypothetical protein
MSDYKHGMHGPTSISLALLLCESVPQGHVPYVSISQENLVYQQLYLSIIDHNHRKEKKFNSQHITSHRISINLHSNSLSTYLIGVVLIKS